MRAKNRFGKIRSIPIKKIYLEPERYGNSEYSSDESWESREITDINYFSDEDDFDEDRDRYEELIRPEVEQIMNEEYLQRLGRY